MRKFYQLGFISLLLILTACADENTFTANPSFDPTITPGTNTGVTLTQNFEATIDGNFQKWNNPKGQTDGSLFGLVGYKGNDSLAISTTSLSPGIYKGAINGQNGIYLYNRSGTFSSTFVSNPNAEIVISSYDPINGRVSGSFSGSIKDIGSQVTKVVSNGMFTNIKLSQIAPVNLGNMTASIAGNSFQSYACIALQNQGAYVLSASNTGATKSITFQFAVPFTVGTHDLSGSNFSNFIADLSSTADPLSSTYLSNIGNGSGTLTITKVDQSAKVIEGSFSFTGENISGQSISVTNGVFQAAIQ